MAGRSRIKQMLNLVKSADANISTDYVSDNMQLINSPKPSSSKAEYIHENILDNSPKPGCSKNSYKPPEKVISKQSPKPGPSKTALNSNDLFHKSSDEAGHFVDRISDLFTDGDETYLVCIDIVSSLVDSLPCYDILENSPKPGCSKNSYKQPEKVISKQSSKPGPSKTALNSNDLFHKSSDEAEHFVDRISDLFTDGDETYLVCIDIVSSLVDSLPCYDMDFSSGSSDEYIPDSNDCEESDNSTYRRSSTRTAQNVVIAGTDTEEESTFWEREGVINGRKRKHRKSLKERRKDREDRKKKRNTGQSYETNKGKVVREREMKILGDCRMKCAQNIPEEFRKKMFDTYWSLGEYNERVQYIANMIEIQNKKSAKLTAQNNTRLYANKYYLKMKTECYRICKGCFLKTFDETAKFIQTTTDKLKESEGLVLNSSRGCQPSSTKISDERLEAVKEHILSFPSYESHYGRAKTDKKFLPPHLCLSEMYDAYHEVTENPVSLTIYSWVFKAQNLSFKRPYLDTCDKCDKLEMLIKFSETEEIKAQNIKLKAEHVKRAEETYDRKTLDVTLSTESNDTFVAAFDLQQCLPTPYLKTGAVFYMRQLWTFNLTIRNCTTKKSYCFMWHEGIGGRGSNQIASCVYSYILNYVPDGIKHLIFYSDNCYGQNKNFPMVCMFLLAIRNHPSLETITHNFFVAGHSHMECDVDHALIEKTKKKTPMDIHHPRDWYQLVRTCGKRQYFTVTEMDTNLFLDFQSLLKGPFVQKKIDDDRNKFNISETAIFRYTREDFPIFKYQVHDSEEWRGVNLLRKRGKSPMSSNVFETDNIPRCYDGPIPISREKKRDLMSILHLMNPSVRRFYENLLSADDVADVHPLMPTEHIES